MNDMNEAEADDIPPENTTQSSPDFFNTKHVARTAIIQSMDIYRDFGRFVLDNGVKSEKMEFPVGYCESGALVGVGAK